MTVTYSPGLGLINIASGTEAGNWGNLTNTNICSLLEQAISGQQNVAVVNNATTLTLTSAQGVINQSRAMAINFQGALTVNKPVIAPATSKLYVVFNSTTGNASTYIEFYAAGAPTGVRVPQGSVDIIWCDGVATYSLARSGLGAYLPLTGGTLTTTATGNITLTTKAMAGQTGDLQWWGDASNAFLAHMTVGGNFSIKGNFAADSLNIAASAAVGANLTANKITVADNVTIGTNIAADSLNIAASAAVGATLYANKVVATTDVISGKVTVGGIEANSSGTSVINTLVADVNGYTVTQYFAHLPGSYAGMFWLMGPSTISLRNDGFGYAPGGWAVSSDRRLKSDIVQITDAVTKLTQLVGSTFLRDDLADVPNPRRYAGIVAQDLSAVLPEAVSRIETVPASDPGGEGTMTIDPVGIIALMLEAVKEMNQTLGALATRVAAIEAQAP